MISVYTQSIDSEADDINQMMKDKWDKYYADANLTDSSPPWESCEPFSDLVNYLNQSGLERNSKCIELGCGSSRSAVFLAEQQMEVTAVDISELAINRAKRDIPRSDLVKWVIADLLSPDIFTTIDRDSFDFVFDMQCFHVLRDIDEEKSCQVIFDLLKPGGIAMVVTGALCPDGSEAPLNPGPPALTKDALLLPFQSTGFELVSIKLSRFNTTVSYGRHDKPPLAWVGVFKKTNSTVT